MTTWYALGVALVIVGAVSGGFGMNLIKASSTLEFSLPWYYRKRLMLGLFLSTIFNTCLDLISFALTPLSVIAPLGGVSIISAALFSAYGFGGTREVFPRPKQVGIALVVGGIVLVALFGPKPSVAVLDMDDVFDNFTNLPFTIYQMSTLVVLTLTFTNMLLDLFPMENLTRTLTAAWAGGMASGLCQSLIKLFATCVASVSLEGSKPWERQPEFTLALMELAIAGVMLFILLKTTIESGQEVSVSTCYYSVCVMLFTIVAGGTFYNEMRLLGSVLQLVGFFVGVVSVIVGITLVSVQQSMLAKGNKISTKDDDAALPASEETQKDGEIIE